MSYFNGVPIFNQQYYQLKVDNNYLIIVTFIIITYATNTYFNYLKYFEVTKRPRQ